MKRRICSIQPPSIQRRFLSLILGLLTTFALGTALTSPVNAVPLNPASDAIPLTVGIRLQSGMTYTGTVTGPSDYGAWSENVVNSGLVSVNASGGFRYGAALWGASGFTVNSFVGHNDSAPLYGSHVVNSTFNGLDLISDSTSTLDHAIYLSAGCSDVTGTNWRLVGGAGYALHLYCETGSGTSSGLSVDGLYMDARKGLYAAVIHNWSNVHLSNVTSYSNRAHYDLWDTQNVLIENFYAEGGTSLVQLRSGHTAQNVIFRNGTYKGPSLTPDGKPIPGVTFENVTLTTTGAPTTTTTAAPTTTTTVPATTTTTAAPTTTTTAASITTTTLALTTTTTVASTTTTTAAPTTTTVSTIPVWALTTTTTTVPTQTTTTTTLAVTPVTTPQSTTTTTSAITPGTAAMATVTLTAPQDQSNVWGKVSVRASVSSLTPIGKVRLFVDGRVLSQDYRQPFAFAWNTRMLLPGSRHALAVVAYGRDGGAIGQDSINVTVRGSNASTASNPLLAQAFSDLGSSSLFDTAVATLAESGVVSGFPDGTFGAEQATTRAQFAKMVVSLLGLADTDVVTTPFSDLGPADANLYPQIYVAALNSIGAAEGVTPGQFAPWNSVSRAQMITMVVRALQTLDAQALTAMPDGSLPILGDLGPQHTLTMATAEANGLLQGIPGYGRSWNPWAPATRGEVAQVLTNLLTLR